MTLHYSGGTFIPFNPNTGEPARTVFGGQDLTFETSTVANQPPALLYDYPIPEPRWNELTTATHDIRPAHWYIWNYRQSLRRFFGIPINKKYNPKKSILAGPYEQWTRKRWR